MFKKIIIALVVIVGVAAGVVAMQPADFTITRSATVNAPPAEVFSQVNDFHKWQAWSPWAKLDPDAKNTFEGPSAGEGAIFKWSGNSQVGEGAMTLVESKPNDYIKIKLDFVRPFAASDVANFTFKPEAGQTQVTWTMSGQKNFVCKAIGLCMNMDKMVGGEFEKGLAQMKTIAEATDKK
jgi:uncharacterized protein YndB with AHSA1/START domain